MVFALALVLSLVLAAALASMVTAPLRRMARATQAMARGDLSARVPGSKLEELGALAQSFNDMADRLKTSFDDLVGEVETRKRRERELEESEGRLRESEDRLQLAIDAAGLGIWDWDVQQDRLVWDDSMYRLYGVAQGRVQRRVSTRGPVPRAGRRRARHRRARGRAARWTASTGPTSGYGDATAQSAPSAAWGRPSAMRTAAPCAWSGSTAT